MIPDYYKASLLITGILSVLVAVLLFYYSAKRNKTGRLLAVAFILLAYPPLLTYVVATGFIHSVPHLYRTGFIAILLFPPTAYVYLRNVLTSQRISRKDLVHLLPVTLYILDFLPFFLLPGAEKMEALTAPGNLGKAIILFKESVLFPGGFYIGLRYVINLFYCIVSLSLLLKILKTHDLSYKKENRKLLRWLGLFTFLQFSLLMPPLTILVEQQEMYQYLTYLFEIGSICALSAISLFFFPEILYGLKGIVVQQEDKAEISTPELDSNTPAVAGGRYLPAAKIEEIKAVVERHLSSGAAYLKPQYTIQLLAIEVGIPSPYISAYINTYEQVNFNDFINHYRIQHCLELFKQGEYKTKTLESIASQCGFNNRNTFTMAFKKVTGKTPVAYIKELPGK